MSSFAVVLSLFYVVFFLCCPLLLFIAPLEVHVILCCCFQHSDIDTPTSCLQTCICICMYVMYVCKCRYSIVVWSWAGVRRSRVQFRPPSTIRVKRQTLQSLCGSAFASGAKHRATGSRTRRLAGTSRSKNNKICM